MKYIGKKVITMLFTLFIVSLLVFFAFSFISGDPATSMLGMEATPLKVAALREELGLNQPVLIRYIQWIGGFFRGDFGTSYSYGIPVTQMIGDKLPITITLASMAFLMVLGLAIPVGIHTAKHVGSKMDQAIYVLNQITMAIPAFFMGIILTYLFGLILHFFTPGGYVSYKTELLGFLGYLIVPAVAIALPKIAMTVKLLRSSMLDEMNKDYVRTAYSKGNDSKNVLYKHVLKNAMIPTITFLGMVLADMVAGSIIVEQVFNIPGLGRILLTSISNRDYPVVQMIILCIAFMVIIINTIVDILYKMVDPRIKNT